MGKANLFSLMLVAGDRPGIVADVTRILLENNFNIEDSSSTLLQGFFAAILIVSHEKPMSECEVKGFFEELLEKKGVSVKVQSIAEPEAAPAGEHYIISVYGSDKPGIVHKVASYLASEKINIIDLQTKVAGKENKPIYIMVLEVVIPEGITEKSWTDKLVEISKELGTDIHVRLIETYEL
jgi:glycine cleavage system transcriptional repressor